MADDIFNIFKSTSEVVVDYSRVIFWLHEVDKDICKKFKDVVGYFVCGGFVQVFENRIESSGQFAVDQIF